MGTGYLGGAYFFARVATGRRWHRVSAGFFPVTAFTWFMLAATVLHWDRFSHGRLGFQVWLILYLVTPLLVPWLWFHSRRTDPGTPEPDDLIVPRAIRAILALTGALFLAGTVLLFFWPSLAISFWPWTLSPLTARVIAGWLALMGVGSLAVSWERRWSAWRVEIESIILWQALLLVGALANLADFASPWNWYLPATAAGLAGAVAIYLALEARRRAAGRRQRPVEAPAP
jgi:peptidoglycan/LPS O-acetylase OafA/YrhL